MLFFLSLIFLHIIFSGKDANPDNNGLYNRLFPPDGDKEEQFNNLLLIDPTANNMARINLIGYTRSYYRVLRDVHLLLRQYCNPDQINMIMDEITTQRINYKASNAHSIVLKIIEDIEGGIYDDWRVSFLIIFECLFFCYLNFLSTGTS